MSEGYPKIGDTSTISDGYHSFDELYEHRHRLYLTIVTLLPELAWASRTHADGSSYEGWFVLGMTLPAGQVSYHLPDRFWQEVVDLGVVRPPPEFDGHTSADVLARFEESSEVLPYMGMP